MAAGADHLIVGVTGADDELPPLLQQFREKTRQMNPIEKRKRDFM
jgi:hypothetical protein